MNVQLCNNLNGYKRDITIWFKNQVASTNIQYNIDEFENELENVYKECDQYVRMNNIESITEIKKLFIRRVDEFVDNKLSDLRKRRDINRYKAFIL